MQYRYQTKSPSGQNSAGVIAAENAMAAAQALRSSGNQVLQLTPLTDGEKPLSERLKAINHLSGPGQ